MEEEGWRKRENRGSPAGIQVGEQNMLTERRTPGGWNTAQTRRGLFGASDGRMDKEEAGWRHPAGVGDQGLRGSSP